MDTHELSRCTTGPDGAVSGSSRAGRAALVLLSGLAVASSGCAQAQAAESQGQQLSTTSPPPTNVNALGVVAGVYYARTTWTSKDASGNVSLPSPNDDAVMLGSDGSLSGFTGTQNAAAFPLFPTNSAGTLGSWRALNDAGKIEIKFFRMIAAPQGWIGNPSSSAAEYFSSGSPLLPTQFLGYVTGRIEATQGGGVLSGGVHVDTFSTSPTVCNELGVPSSATQAVPCRVSSADGFITMTAIDPAKGPPASLFAAPPLL